MFIPRGGAIIEFAITPMANRSYGWLAMVMGHDYWHVPQISSNYLLKYTVDDELIQLAVRLLKHVIETKGLSDLLVKHSEL